MPEWKSELARRLVKRYQRGKRKVLESYDPADELVVHNRDPRFVAGMLLTVYGGVAVKQWDVMRVGRNVWPAETRQLLVNALNAELRAVHGTIQCHYCGRVASGSDDIQGAWLSSSESGRHVCPDCIARQHLREGDEVQRSN